MRTTISLLVAALLAGCHTPPATPQSKLQQVYLTTQTGPYSYLRMPGRGGGGPH